MWKKLLLAMVIVGGLSVTAETASARRWGYYGGYYPAPVVRYYGPRYAPRHVVRSYYRPVVPVVPVAPVAPYYYYGVAPFTPLAYPRPFVPYTTNYYYPGFGPGYYY